MSIKSESKVRCSIRPARVTLAFRLWCSLLFWGVAGHASMARAQTPGTFTAAGCVTISRAGSPATLLPNGKVLLVGVGAELYDPDTRTCTPAGDRTISGISKATLLPNGKVLIVGAVPNSMIPTPAHLSPPVR